MNTRDIQFFLKVYECESINLAAEQLFITPQGLSNVISKLEKELGADLFVRSRAGTYPTEFGKVLKPHIEKMADHFDDALREIEQVRNQKEGSVRLGFAFGALSNQMTQAPLEFQELHQNYSIEYMELPDKTIEDFVDRGELDIGFTSCTDPARFDSVFMYEKRIMFVVHEKSRFYDRKSVSVAEICEEPLTLRNDNFATTEILMQEFAKCNVKPSLMMRTGGIVRSMLLCAEGRANTIILESLDDDFRHDNIRVIPFDEDLRWPLYMITRKEKEISRAAREFIDYIHQP